MRCVPALCSAEDSVTRPEGWGGVAGRGGQDDAGELGAGYPGEGRLMLVFAANLKKVEKIGRGGVDCDEVFRGSGSGGWEAGDGEFVRALGRSGVSWGADGGWV